MLIGPGIYLDRPLYQYQDLALRWFDYWLCGVENGAMDDPPIRCFIPPTGEWNCLADWPPPEATWMSFFLHENGLLSEHDLWPGEGTDSFHESAFEHGSLTYASPPLVENTELLGPIPITLYVSSTQPEALIFVTLLAIDRQGQEHELTRGWLRASQRKLRDDSTPWEPVLAHGEGPPLQSGAHHGVPRRKPRLARGPAHHARQHHRHLYVGWRHRELLRSLALTATSCRGRL
ncbi:MAG TPA: CocE/NonD family hydrolase C-terminal non-catalytic domain-containing protein [Chloroflexota bacterium]